MIIETTIKNHENQLMIILPPKIVKELNLKENDKIYIKITKKKDK